MSKGAQESTAKDVSAGAKPRPMSLVSRNLLCAKRTLPQDSSASKNVENQELDQSFVSSSARKLVRNKNQDPTTYSQERRQDDTLSSSTWKLVQSGEGWNSLISKSPTIDTLRRSSTRWRGTSTPLEDLCIDPGILFCQRWKPLFILDQITTGFWKCTGTQTSIGSSICSISHRDWCWSIKPKFWMCTDCANCTVPLYVVACSLPVFLEVTSVFCWLVPFVLSWTQSLHDSHISSYFLIQKGTAHGLQRALRN